MTQTKAHQLEYAPQWSWYRKIRWGRWIALSTFLAIALAGWRYRIEVTMAAQFWWWSHRCATYQEPNGQVVYECDPQRASVLLRDGRYAALLGGPVQLIPPENGAWEQLVSTCPDHLGWASNLKMHAPLFMHELRTPRGRRMLVLVTYAGFGSSFLDSPVGKFLANPANSLRDREITPPSSTQPEAYVSGYLLIAETLVPSFLGPPTQARGQQIMIETQRRMTVRSGVGFADMQNPQDVIQRIHAGRVDPSDAAHFTIDVDSQAGAHTLDGRLMDDGRVRIERQ